MAASFSLKEHTKNRFIEMMIRQVPGRKVLIMDELGMRILSSCLHISDIVYDDIIMEKLELDRMPIPIDAIYFICPCSVSIDHMLKDWPGGKKNLYKNAHVFFTSGLRDITKISASPMIHHIQHLVELHIEYIVQESQVFTLDMPGLEMFFSPTANIQANTSIVARKIATLCFSLGVNPIIRFSSNTNITKDVAKIIQTNLDTFYSNPNNSSFLKDKEKEQTTLLILDRTQDLVAPLLHEFTYQAMCHDLLPIEKDIYKYQYQKANGEMVEKDALLNETDDIWVKLRHMYIADSNKCLDSEFKEFCSTNAIAMQKTTSNQSINKSNLILETIREIPQYQALLGKYSLHVSISTLCITKFNDLQLIDVATLEQNMATGGIKDGQKISKNLREELISLLDSPNISLSDKTRLLMIYIITQNGIKEGDRAKLLEKAQVSYADQNMIANLTYLGVNLMATKKNMTLMKKNSYKGHSHHHDVPYDLWRYQTQVRSISEDLIEGKLTPENFPFVKSEDVIIPTAAITTTQKSKNKSAITMQAIPRPKWMQKNDHASKISQKNDPANKLIIFIIGGMTYSEMRSVYEVSKSHHQNVIIGSTHIIKPIQFMSDLKKLNEGGI